MKLIVTLRDPSLGDDAREYAIQRISQLERYFQRITSAEVILSVATNHRNHDRRKTQAEFIVHANRGAILVARGEAAEIHEAIDMAKGELKRELLKHKERLIDRHRVRKLAAARRGRG